MAGASLVYRTVIADDSPQLLGWLYGILSDSEEFDVVGQAATGADAVAQCLALTPNLLITDFFLPDMDGIEVVNSLRAQLPEMMAIVISSHDADAHAAMEVLGEEVAFLPKSSVSVAALKDLLPGGEAP